MMSCIDESGKVRMDIRCQSCVAYYSGKRYTVPGEGGISFIIKPTAIYIQSGRRPGDYDVFVAAGMSERGEGASGRQVMLPVMPHNISVDNPAEAA